MKTIFIKLFIIAVLLPAISCKSPLDVGGNTVVTVEQKPPALPKQVEIFGKGTHYSGSTNWNISTTACTINYLRCDTTHTDKPVLWSGGTLVTDSQGAESPQSGQEVAAALRSIRFRLDSLPLDSRGMNLIDSPAEKLGIEFIVERLTNRYDAVKKVWEPLHLTDTIIPDGSVNAYATVRLYPDPSQTLVNNAKHSLKFEVIFQLRVVMQEAKNIDPTEYFIRGTTGAQIQY